MEVKITLVCPACASQSIKKNGMKSYGKQNYCCIDCGRQFIGDHALDYNGCHSEINHRIEMMLVRGMGIRDVMAIEGVRIKKILSVLTNSQKEITPKQSHYDALEVDEFRPVGKKKRKLWLVYAYHRETGEIVAWILGRRNFKTAEKLRQKITALGVSFDTIYTDDWNSFIKAFSNDTHVIGKEYTVGIEGNNCRLRHRIRRAFRRTCCFSKKLLNHIKAFRLAFFYINFGYV